MPGCRLMLMLITEQPEKFILYQARVVLQPNPNFHKL